MDISSKINRLRQSMKDRNVDVYIVPSADFHQSEYVGEYFKSREYITGFTGSAGTAVISQNYAGLWTDGRYFIQAEKELEGTGIKLNKVGLSGTISIVDFIRSTISNNGTLAFDGRVVSYADGVHYEKLLSSKNIHIKYNEDLIDTIWVQRPSMPNDPIYLLPDDYSGESRLSKIQRVQKELKQLGATSHLLSSLDDIAWLLNIRGNDIQYSPIALCYLWMSLDEVHLFIDENKLSTDMKNEFYSESIFIHPYNDIFQFMFESDSSNSLLIDSSKISYSLYHSIPEKTTIIDHSNPTTIMKAQKNEIEIENTKNAHLKDAIAHTKFLYWLKTNYKSINITEMDAASKLEQLRSEQDLFISPSFETISAFGPHAAMCHYSTSHETNVVLNENSLYLVDSGGHYLDGTTDITRTIALGEISSELKSDYTNVLRGNLALSNAKFLYGCTGENIDILARQFLWNHNQDYLHGTGHGVGNLLSVHEGPCSIKWRYRGTPIPLENGMILSNEPGIYIENSHGIRLENELLVRKGVSNEYGQFMHFETLTYVPFDLDAIDENLLSAKEKHQLNAYHKKVYNLVSPYLNSDEKQWLETYTREI